MSITEADRERARADLDQAASRLGVALHPEAASRLLRYTEALLEINQVLNLTGHDDVPTAWRALVVDSLAYLPAVERVRPDRPDWSLVDIGAGAGVPSLVLWLAWPAAMVAGLSVLAIEARRKKAEALRTLVAQTQAAAYEVYAGRAEDLARTQVEIFDVAVARAVGPLAEVIEYAMPLLKVGGALVVAKSPQQIEGELPAGRVAAQRWGADEPRLETFDPGGRPSLLVTVVKRASPAEARPRRPGRARKESRGRS